jgi:heme-degrading monooxygenase HmoA
LKKTKILKYWFKNHIDPFNEITLIELTMLKKILFFALIFMIGITIEAYSQVVYVAEYKEDADKIVYVSEWKSDANLIVYKSDFKSEAENTPGIWYFSEWKSDADMIVYFTEWKSEADIIVYFTEWKSEAGWVKKN